MEKKFRSVRHRVLTMVLAVALVIGGIPLWTSAAENDAGQLGQSDKAAAIDELDEEPRNQVYDPNEVAAIDELDEEIRYQVYGLNTGLDELNLPETLTGTDEDDVPITIDGVTWESDPEFDGTVVETYEFTAVLPDEYTLANGVDAPVIVVGIEQGIVALAATQNSGSAEDIAAYLNGWTGGTADSLTATYSGNTVTVTGSITDAEEMLQLSIDENVTVNWQADVSFVYFAPIPPSYYPSTITLSSSGGAGGTFDLSAGTITGCSNTNSDGVILVDSGVTLKITGGHLVQTAGGSSNGKSGSAVYISNGAVVMTSGTVTSVGYGITDRNNNDNIEKSVIIQGGSITSDSQAIFGYSSSVVLIEGGTLASTGTYGAIAAYSQSSVMFVIGGTISTSAGTGVDAVAVDSGLVVFWDGVTGEKTAFESDGLTCISSNSYGEAYWYRDSDGDGAIMATRREKEYICKVAGVTVKKVPQPKPTIDGGNINVPFGTTNQKLNVSGEGTGELVFSSSNPSVATVSSDGVITIGTEASVINSTTNITVKRQETESYEESLASDPITLTVVKGSQKTPNSFTLELTSYSPGASIGDESFVVTIPPVAGVEYRFDIDGATGSYGTQNSITASSGQRVVGYIRLPETATHNASSTRSSSINLPANPVRAITVTGQGGKDSITTKGGSLQMVAGVTPAQAASSVKWSVSNTNLATIDQNTGKLTAKADGKVIVYATATDVTGVVGQTEIAISGQSTGSSGGGSGGNGGSGSSGGSRGSGNSSGGSSKPDNLTTSSRAVTAATEWVATPNAGSTPSKSSGKVGVKAEDWQKLTGATYTHDTLDGNSVQVRIVISNPNQWKQETLISGHVKSQSVDSTRSFFEKWFSNNIRVIHFDQQEDWEHTVSVAAKVDLTGLDTDNLVLYSYTKGNNTYRRIASPNYYIDANGYLRFVTPYAGSIVISEGTLDKK